MNRLIRFTRRFFYNKGKEIWWFLGKVGVPVAVGILMLAGGILVFAELWWVVASIHDAVKTHRDYSFMSWTEMLNTSTYICFWVHASIVAGLFIYWIGKNVVKAWRETK
jgi:membrane protein insertase Oxa1/YidC/SpoIIIJ